MDGEESDFKWQGPPRPVSFSRRKAKQEKVNRLYYLGFGVSDGNAVQTGPSKACNLLLP